MIYLHQAIIALNPSIVTIRGDEAFDKDEKPVAYDLAQAQAKLAQMQADEKRLFKEMRRENLIRKYSHRRFYRFLLIPLGHLYDPGFQESDVKRQRELFTSRANFLLKNKFIQSSFGFYRIEYSILDGYARSYFSLNNGLTYKKCAEFELRGTPQEYVETLANMISATEGFLRNTIKEKTPPYLMNMK